MNEAERYLRNLREQAANPHGAEGRGASAAYCLRNAGSAGTGKITAFRGWWGIEGRLGRQLYLQRLAIIFGAIVLTGAVLNMIAIRAGALELVGRPIAALCVFAAMPFALPQHTRRLHDLGWSGWWQLLFLVPIFGLFFRIYLWCKPGTPGRNPYGPSVA